MKAFILAAGIGSRLKPWTESHPKALVPVGGVPMLERVILGLRDSGVGEFVINVHHFAAQIIEFLKSKDYFGLDIKISDESDRLLDTGGALLKATPLFQGDDPVIIHNADIFTTLDYAEMLNVHINSNADATLLVDRRDSSRTLWFDTGTTRLCGWSNKKTGQIKPAGLDLTDLTPLSFGGIHIISPNSILPAISKFSQSEVFSIIDFYIENCKSLKLRGYIPRDKYQWIDVGKPDSLEAARSLFNRRKYEDCC